MIVPDALATSLMLLNIYYPTKISQAPHLLLTSFSCVTAATKVISGVWEFSGCSYGLHAFFCFTQTSIDILLVRRSLYDAQCFYQRTHDLFALNLGTGFSLRLATGFPKRTMYCEGRQRI
jgi:hypothetical protein